MSTPGSTRAYTAVEPLWRGETVAILAAGPSLTQADVDQLRGRCRVLAINCSIRLAPWADALYACDGRWWEAYEDDWQGTPATKYTLNEHAAARYDLHLLETGEVEGYDERPWAVSTGKNGGYQTINLAGHFGVARIILLGYDMQMTGGKSHWHGDHRKPCIQTAPSGFATWCAQYAGLAPILERRGIDVVNCTRKTALTCFRRADLADVLQHPSRPLRGQSAQVA